MLKSRRALYLQVVVLAVVISSLLLVSHFLPLVDFLVELQQDVMRLGAWSAVCYQLRFAACNVLLLPGGVL